MQKDIKGEISVNNGEIILGEGGKKSSAAVETDSQALEWLKQNVVKPFAISEREYNRAFEVCRKVL